MGERSRQNAQEARSNAWKVGLDRIGTYIALFVSVTTLLPVLLVSGYVGFEWAIFHDTRPRDAWLGKILPGYPGKDEGSEPAQRLPLTAGFARSGPLYLATPSADQQLAASLIEFLHESGIQVTDNPTQSAVTLEVAADVAVRPGITVGSTTTWQAVAASSLKALDTRSRATLLRTTFEGQGTATQADLARRYARDDAAKHLAAEYETFAKTSGHQPKQEATR